MPERAAVLHFVERWLPVSEGFVHGLVTRLDRPSVVVTPLPTEHIERFPHDPIVRLPALLQSMPGGLHRRVMTASLLVLAHRHAARLVHVHHGYRAYEVLGAARRGGLAMVVSLHGHDVTGYLADRPGVYRGVLDRADAVIVPSRYLTDLAVAAGAQEDSIRVIPSGVDTTWFSATPLPLESRLVVFVGRFVEKKGIDVLAQAWPAVRSAVPDARLLLLGAGPLEASARSIGPGAEVVLAPDRHAVREAIRTARVVVSPSRTAPGDAVESLLIVNLEAQASGRPVVSTLHGAIPEFVLDGETGVLVPEGDPAALADALVAVLTDDDLACRLAAAGPTWAARFDAARCAAAVDRLYDELEGLQR